MPPEILEMIGPVIVLFLIGCVILLFPISRRLGGVMEEWIKLKRETSPDRERLSNLEQTLHEVRHLVESVNQRVTLLSERQDFMESLIESKRPVELPAGRAAADEPAPAATNSRASVTSGRSDSASPITSRSLA